MSASADPRGVSFLDPATGPTRGVGRFAAWLDARGEAFFVPLRRSASLCRAIAAVSNLGVYSVIWLALTGVGLALMPDRRGELWVLLAAIPIEFALTNGVVKAVFRRARPIERLSGSEVARLIRPKTSSFPSGHSSAAAMSAVGLLGAGWIGPIAVALAALIATSRVVLRLHYASDVVGGVCWGISLGFLVRALGS